MGGTAVTLVVVRAVAEDVGERLIDGSLKDLDLRGRKSLPDRGWIEVLKLFDAAFERVDVGVLLLHRVAWALRLWWWCSSGCHRVQTSIRWLYRFQRKSGRRIFS